MIMWPRETISTRIHSSVPQHLQHFNVSFVENIGRVDYDFSSTDETKHFKVSEQK
jgi:hypothetical protein